MKKALVVSYAAILTVWCVTVSAATRQYHQRGIDPLVSTEWLSEHLNDAGLVIIDGRSEAIYSKGHIPRAGNVPVERWWVTGNKLLLELPSPDALRDRIGQAGIDAGSKVVLVNENKGDFDRGHVVRVAWTLIYGGVKSVAILDGGYDKWTSEGRAVSAEPYVYPAVAYAGTFRDQISVSKLSVKSQLNSSQATILDNRMPEDFFGISPWVVPSKAGHIPGAVCLPISWAFTAKGIFKDLKELEAIAQGVVGNDLKKQIITYCGVGGFAPTWWFVLSEMLGYEKVGVYDGSIEEWTADPEAPVIKYRW